MPRPNGTGSLLARSSQAGGAGAKAGEVEDKTGTAGGEGAGAGGAGTGQGGAGEGQGGAPGQGGAGEAGGGAGTAGGAGEGTGGEGAGTGEGAGEGAGDPPQRPDFLPPKFWDDEKGEVRLKDLFNNYEHARQQVSRGDNKVPAKAEDYKIEVDTSALAKLGIEKPDADPLIGWFRQAAHEIGLNQSHFSQLVAGYLEKAGSMVETTDGDKEFASLGPQAQVLIDSMSNWADDLHKNGILNDADLRAMNELTSTADGVRLLQHLREYYGEQAIPVNPGEEEGGMPTNAELAAMGNDERYGTDAEYTKKVDDLYDKKYGKQPAGQSIVTAA